MDLEAVVDGLSDDATIDAVVRDGWPEPMVRAGFALHRQTWNPDALEACVRDELAAIASPPSPPSSMCHIWPALPGAGVTPVLLAHLLGVNEQVVRPSRRGRHFAERFATVAGLPLTTDLPHVDRFIVSGSDETISHICGEVGEHRVVGYGDRQSFAVIPDDRPERYIEALAKDAVMWLGRGCFSLHAVLFVGSNDRARAFGERLAAAISDAESALVPTPDEGLLARRAQGIGVAQFETDVWPARIGWVELRDRWDGRPREANVVVVVPCDDPADALTLAPRHRQAIATPNPELAANLHATRVCAPGELQCPPANWPHDGASNAGALLGEYSGRL